MSYIIVSDRNIHRALEGKETKPYSTSISDLILGPEECLIWLMSEQQRIQIFDDSQSVHITDLQRFPIAANYSEVGSLDIRNKILVQDPVQRIGPYVLNRQEDKGSRQFERKGLCSGAEIVDVHAAGDKIPNGRFYFCGDIAEIFNEIRMAGYSFSDHHQ